MNTWIKSLDGQIPKVGSIIKINNMIYDIVDVDIENRVLAKDVGLFVYKTYIIKTKCGIAFETPWQP